MKRKLELSVVWVLLVILSKGVIAQTPQNQTNYLSKVNFNNLFGLIIIPVRINDSETLYFNFDTGFDVNVLDKGVAEKLGLDLSNTITEKQPGGSIEYSVVKNLNFEINGNQMHNEDFIVTQISQMGQFIGHQLDGIIGVDFMLKYQISIDYDDLSMVIYDTLETISTANYLSLPFNLDNKEPFIYCSIRNANGKIVISKYKMDTGSTDALGLNKNFIEDSQIINDSTKLVYEKGLGVGGETSGIRFNVNNFKMGNSVFPTLSISATIESGGFENREDAGTIGAQILSQFNWILDFKNNHVYCVENQKRSNNQKTDKSGMWVIENTKKEKMIFDIIENSPAHKAGLKAGQIIEEINNISADAFSLNEIKELMKSDNGTIVNIRIKDNKEERILILRDLN
jgi:predicted aspartyl protease